MGAKAKAVTFEMLCEELQGSAYTYLESLVGSVEEVSPHAVAMGLSNASLVILERDVSLAS